MKNAIYHTPMFKFKIKKQEFCTKDRVILNMFTLNPSGLKKLINKAMCH